MSNGPRADNVQISITSPAHSTPLGDEQNILSDCTKDACEAWVHNYHPGKFVSPGGCRSLLTNPTTLTTLQVQLKLQTQLAASRRKPRVGRSCILHDIGARYSFIVQHRPAYATETAMIALRRGCPTKHNLPLASKSWPQMVVKLFKSV